MLTQLDLMVVLRAGADSLDHHNACARCGADVFTPCTDSGGSRQAAICPDRVPGDPMLATALRAMADAAHNRWCQLTGERI